MMNLHHGLVVALLGALSLRCFGFAPPRSSVVIAPKAQRYGCSTFMTSSKLFMSNEPEKTEDVTPSQPTGDFYDDEVEPATTNVGISDSMRERLMKEASTGLDANAKQTNVLLYIIIGVAILVIVGGAGIFY